MSLAELTGLSPQEQIDRLTRVDDAIGRIVKDWNGTGFDPDTAGRFALLVAEKRKIKAARTARDETGSFGIRYAG